MTDTLLSLLPYIIGSAVVPAQIIIILLLLKNPQGGLPKALLFVVGMTAARLLQGLLFGWVFDFGDSTDEADGSGLIVDTLLLVLGIILLITAYKKWRKEVDPDEPPPGWLTKIDQATVIQAFAFGFAIPLISPKLWVFLLSALGTIDYAQIGQPASTVTFFLFVALAQSLLLLPILIRILLPQRSVNLLAAASAWLTRNNRGIVIVVSLVFGLFFLYQGASGFLQ